MKTELIIRKAVRVLLLNKKNELLLMYNENFPTKSTDGKSYHSFWCTIGGKIEDNENIEQALIREIYEETGLKKHQVTIGPSVWINSVDCILRDIPTRLEEIFIVATTSADTVTLEHLTNEEKPIVKQLAWFSLEDINRSTDIIFPLSLADYLPDVLTKKYPAELIAIHQTSISKMANS